MKLVTFRRTDGPPETGVVVEQNVIALAGAGVPDIFAVLAGGRQVMAQVENWTYQPPADSVLPLASVTLMAPVPRPPKLICVGLNYRDPAIESKIDIPKVPTIFSKFASSVIGPCEPVVLPRNSTRPDYEAHFAFALAQGGRHI